MCRSLLYSLIISVFTFTLASCGGGGSAGIGGTGITSSGTISGFGSIFVNGVEFNTDNVNNVSGDLSQVADLRLGMVVTVRGQIDNNGTTGTADSIDVDIELEGPVANAPILDSNTNTKSFTVLGRSVIASDGSTVFDGSGFSFASIAQDDVVEVSGYLDANGRLQATRIEKKGTLNLGNTEVEVNGIVDNILSAVSFELKVDNTVLTINDPNAVAAAAGITISNGLELEIEGLLTNNSEIRATEIKLDDDLFDNNDSGIEIEGFISNFIDPSNFTINGQQIDASSATIVPNGLTLANNVKVEVEGTLSGGVLIASEVEGRSGEIRIDSNVSAVDTNNNTITLSFSGSSVTVTVDSQTKLEDDIGSNPLTLAAIGSGDFLKIKAIDNNGVYVATDVKREADQMDGEVRLRGPVTVIDKSTPGQESVTILGITYASDANTDFEINDEPKTRAEFFTALDTGGKIVDIKDDKVGGAIDGVADEMDLKN